MDQPRIPPQAAGTVSLLRERGHIVTIRCNKHGSFRYRIDDGRELQFIEMSRFFARKYEPNDTKAVRGRDRASRPVAKGGRKVSRSGRKNEPQVDSGRRPDTGVRGAAVAADDQAQAFA